MHVEIDALIGVRHDKQRQIETRRPQPRHDTIAEIAGGEHNSAHLGEIGVRDVYDFTPRVDKTSDLRIDGNASLWSR